MAYRDDVADVAYAAAIAHSQGKATYRPYPDAEAMNLTQAGYCARLVRQAHESAMQLPAFGWEFARANARDMEEALRGHECIISRGAVVAMNGTSHRNGHIGIYLGAVPGFTGNQIVHNTSSTSWGPGTVITAYKRVQGIVTGFYSALPVRVPAIDPAHPKVVLLPGSELVHCRAVVEDGVTRVDLRPLAEALGYEVVAEHLVGQGKLYLRPRPA